MLRHAQSPAAFGMQPGMAAGTPGSMTPMPMSMPGSGPATAPMADAPFPGAGLLPRDGQITMQIAEQSGGQSSRMATAWMSVEISRCRNGVFEAGGCFGPNGEIVKAIRVIHKDLTEGPGDNNELFGKDGWVRRTFGW